MRADYHLHCEFSDDSRERMENQIEQAIALGLDEICFTDHVDYGIKKDWSEGGIQWRGSDSVSSGAEGLDPMANVNYPEYFSKLDRMRETYRGRITIKKGLEFGIQTHTCGQYRRLYDTYRKELDFVLLSMHQVHDQEFWTQDFQRSRSQQEYNEEYYREIYEVQKIFKDYSVLAHLDLICRYDRNGIYQKESNSTPPAGNTACRIPSLPETFCGSIRIWAAVSLPSVPTPIPPPGWGTIWRKLTGSSGMRSGLRISAPSTKWNRSSIPCKKQGGISLPHHTPYRCRMITRSAVSLPNSFVIISTAGPPCAYSSPAKSPIR